jgi:hypothetical protein
VTVEAKAISKSQLFTSMRVFAERRDDVVNMAILPVTLHSFKIFFAAKGPQA